MNWKSRFLTVACATLLGVAIAVPLAPTAATAQLLESDVDDLRYRVRQLERQRKALKARGSDIPSSLATRFKNRLNQMERTIQKLTAKVEDLSHRISKIEKNRKTFKADVDYRLGLLEKNGAGKAGSRKTGSSAQKASLKRGAADRSRRKAGPRDTGPNILPRGKEIDQYRFAIGELRKAKYQRAARAFREFIRKHPRGRFTGNAYYWLGETYFAQRKYQLAAIRFADGFRKFPKHSKAPDNLLKLGMAMARLNKPREACASFAELRRRYPAAPSYVKRKAARERKKLDCRT